MADAALNAVEDRTGYVPEGEGPIGNEWISGPSPEWVSAVKSDLTGCLELARRMLEMTGRMADDVRVIRRCVMGDE